MRHEVRSKIAAGESPAAIKAWLVARYGNWVSYDPPFDYGDGVSCGWGRCCSSLSGGWLRVRRAFAAARAIARMQHDLGLDPAGGGA